MPTASKKDVIKSTQVKVTIDESLYRLVEEVGSKYRLGDLNSMPFYSLDSTAPEKAIASKIDEIVTSNLLKAQKEWGEGDADWHPFELGLSKLVHQCSAQPPDHSEMERLKSSNEDLTSVIDSLNSQIATINKANAALITLFVIAIGGTPPELNK